MSWYEELVDRVRGPRALGAPPPLSRWAWAADGLLALALAITTIVGDLNRSYVDVHPDPEDAPFPLPVPPSIPQPSFPPELPQAPQPVPAVEHLLPPVDGWELSVAALTALPLVLRRRFPLAVYWVVMGATVLLHQGDVAADATTLTFASGLVAAYSAAMYSPHRTAVVVSLVSGVVLYAVFPLVPDVDEGLVPLLVLLPIALASHGAHLWRQRERALRGEREAELRRAVEAERSRIARELHDVVTHNVSMMTIQAGAARTVLAASPDQAREAMLAVEAAGRTALSELRHVMGLLTMAAEGPDPAVDVELAPQPGLDRLTELTDRVRASGVPVEVAVRGDPVALSAGVDLAAYRVVQEALTNVVKHAPDARVSVTVEYEPERLRVEVSDTGAPASGAGASRDRGTGPGASRDRGTARRATEPGGGQGLLGLRERLAVYGGTLRAGRGPDGGYRVRAVIPWEAP
ncbi:histidine kinase [Streptomyces sp. NBC_00250]|uniref:sensor histidine kinase n=1 Tax=Streptomyces sp. NBC_00250 TaxID=2903641 RepID=UPI002E28DF83|nr:histidine kinase [Streptomyces sp. NBC_00250]